MCKGWDLSWVCVCVGGCLISWGQLLAHLHPLLTLRRHRKDCPTLSLCLPCLCKGS